MLSTIESINSAVNNFIWGVPAMICIIGVGLYLTLRTHFLQIRKFPYAIKTTIGRMFRKRDASDGSLTPFQAVCTALAATVGTGNISGVAGAIAIGGPGAVFWMWLTGVFGIATKYTEVGYVGRDVESMIRDLTECSVRLVKEEQFKRVSAKANRVADEKLTAILMEARKQEKGELAADVFKAQILENLQHGRYDNELIEMEIIDATKPMTRPYAEKISIPKEVMERIKLEDYIGK